MEEIIITEPQLMEERKTFNFKENKVEILTLDELKRTYKENDIFGKPLRGMYHYEILDAVQDILNANNLDMEITEIFAAQNKSKQQPGVVINPEIEKKYCEGAIEAHVLRRVYANIQVRNFDNEELTTNVAMAFHQDSVQLAYGPMVKICHNQCILSPERVFTTARNMGIDQIIRCFADSMQHLQQHIEEDKETIERMRQYHMTPQMVLQTIGIFEANAVKYYSKDQRIHNKEIFPLNISQIGRFTEDMLIQMEEKHNEVTLWDLYNVATNLYKADQMEIPTMFPQHLALNNHVQMLLA